MTMRVCPLRSMVNSTFLPINSSLRGGEPGNAKMTTALLDRLTHHCDIVEPVTTAGALKAATTIKQPALAPSPQPRPAPTPRALPS
ncbi:hypothetical protein ACVWWG_006327 [Bradyrhizobium sp. LB7.2]